MKFLIFYAKLNNYNVYIIIQGYNMHISRKLSFVPRVFSSHLFMGNSPPCTPSNKTKSLPYMFQNIFAGHFNVQYTIV